MCVLEVKSTAWNPTRSSVGAIARTSGVVKPVALQRLWLPSRVVVSTKSIERLTRSRGLHAEKRCVVFHELGVLVAHLDDRSRYARGNRVHHLHRLDDADGRIRLDAA